VQFHVDQTDAFRVFTQTDGQNGNFAKKGSHLGFGGHFKICDHTILRQPTHY
jgi:hypothetical protein